MTESLSTGEIVSHYRILEKLGEGGMGIVYLAEDMHLGRHVAIKTLTTRGSANQQFRRRFRNEARLASKLSNPHIATVYDYGETSDGQPYLVMELVRGKTLSDLIRENSLTMPRSVEIVSQVAEALAEAHRHGLVHRDIKPANIAVNERDSVKVLDFGLAKEVLPKTGDGDRFSTTSANTQTREGIVVGTPMYLSPEQALGLPIDARSDLFSLGSVLYECITGQPAFAGKSDADICAKVIRDDPPSPSALIDNVPVGLDEITRKALTKDPDHRYQTAQELLVALKTDQSREIDDDNPKTHPQPVRHFFSRAFDLAITVTRRRTAYIVASVALAVLLLLLWRYSHPRTYQAPADAQHVYEQGVQAVQKGSYYEAVQLFERALEIDGRFCLAHARAAESWTELDNNDRAKDAIAQANACALTNDRKLTALDGLYLQAINGIVLRNLPGAINTFEQIASQVQTDLKISAYMDLARAYEKNEQPKEAEQAYSSIVDREPNALALTRLGVLYGRRQAFDPAFEAFHKAEVLYKQAGNDIGATEVFIQRGILLDNLDRTSEAQEQLRIALDMSRKTRTSYQQVRSLLQLGSVLNTQTKADIARQYITDAIEIAQAEGMDDLATKALIDLGNMFFLNGKYDEAENSFNLALQNSTKHKGLQSKARALLSLGSLRMQQGKPDGAINYIQQALAFYQPGGYRKQTSQALLLLGRANDYKGDYDSAQSALREQLRLANESGDRSQQARAHMELGSSLHHQEKYVEALEHFNESYQLDFSLGNQSQLGYDLLNRGIVYLKLGQFGEATSDFGQVSNSFAKNNTQLTAWVNLSYAWLGMSNQNYRNALTKSHLAMQLASTQFRDIFVHATYTHGLALALNGTPNAGVGLCKDAVDAATLTGDPRLVAYSRLAFAEALLIGGNAKEAMLNADEAKRSFEQSGQIESEWRALVLVARAANQSGDIIRAREQASRAHELSVRLEQEWGKDIVTRYLTRLDIKKYRKDLDSILREVSRS